MYWLIILLVSFAALLVFCLVGIRKYDCTNYFIIALAWLTVNYVMLLSLSLVKNNLEDKHEWYLETRLKYAEAEGIEKTYLEMNDVMTYNLWYTENKEALENPWSFKSAVDCEFDYIEIKGD